jgi:hypothetical protein
MKVSQSPKQAASGASPSAYWARNEFRIEIERVYFKSCEVLPFKENHSTRLVNAAMNMTDYIASIIFIEKNNHEGSETKVNLVGWM